VRRHWPDTLISWSRMLAGKFKDPVFGRDVLLGTLFGLLAAMTDQLQPLVEAGLGKPPTQPFGFSHSYALDGLRGSIATVLFQAAFSFSNALLVFFLFFIFRLLFKREWLAAVLLALLFCIPSLGAQNPLIDALFTAPFIVAYLWILERFGLVALTVLYFVNQLADQMPLTTPLTAWYTEGALLGMVVIVAWRSTVFISREQGSHCFKEAPGSFDSCGLLEAPHALGINWQASTPGSRFQGCRGR